VSTVLFPKHNLTSTRFDSHLVRGPDLASKDKMVMTGCHVQINNGKKNASASTVRSLRWRQSHITSRYQAQYGVAWRRAFNRPWQLSTTYRFAHPLWSYLVSLRANGLQQMHTAIFFLEFGRWAALCYQGYRNKLAGLAKTLGRKKRKARASEHLARHGDLSNGRWHQRGGLTERASVPP
jgi:hypothetical protein